MTTDNEQNQSISRTSMNMANDIIAKKAQRYIVGLNNKWFLALFCDMRAFPYLLLAMVIVVSIFAMGCCLGTVDLWAASVAVLSVVVFLGLLAIPFGWQYQKYWDIRMLLIWLHGIHNGKVSEVARSLFTMGIPTRCVRSHPGYGYVLTTCLHHVQLPAENLRRSDSLCDATCDVHESAATEELIADVEKALRQTIWARTLSHRRCFNVVLVIASLVVIAHLVVQLLKHLLR